MNRLRKRPAYAGALRLLDVGETRGSIFAPEPPLLFPCEEAARLAEEERRRACPPPRSAMPIVNNEDVAAGPAKRPRDERRRKTLKPIIRAHPPSPLHRDSPTSENVKCVGATPFFPESGVRSGNPAHRRANVWPWDVPCPLFFLEPPLLLSRTTVWPRGLGKGPAGPPR